MFSGSPQTLLALAQMATIYMLSHKQTVYSFTCECLRKVCSIIVIDVSTESNKDFLAQLVEHWIPNPKAIGSTPVEVMSIYCFTHQ